MFIATGHGFPIKPTMLQVELITHTSLFTLKSWVIKPAPTTTSKFIIANGVTFAGTNKAKR